jgi:uncharacterized protein YndB with AHSA1/START domain
MVKKIIVGIVAVITLFLVYVALKSPEIKVSRSAKISAPAEKVFSQVNDFHLWEAWSPWAKLDPNSKVTFAGPDSGKDAVFTWDGNDQVGSGRMTITESKPNERILIKLEFMKPMEATNQTEFTFKPIGDQTEVTWTMTGQNNFVSRIFCTLMNIEKTLAGQFDQGLASMKAIVETPAK